MAAGGESDRSMGSGRAGDVLPRELGRYGDVSAGPTLIVIGGMHGNEPGGVIAIQRVVERIEQLRAAGGSPAWRGQVVLLTGNREALRHGHRFIDRDLNRRWFDDKLQDARAHGTAEGASAEDGQQLELLEIFDELEAASTKPLTFLDLHSTSSNSPAFAVLPDAPRNHRVSLPLGLPLILGLEESTDGTMIGYYNDRGHAGLAVEGGQHDDPRTPDRLEAAVWRTMVSLGIVHEREVERMPVFERILKDASRGRPRAVEIVYSHHIAPSDGFVMEPGWTSFQPVKKGQLVARDHRGEIHCPLDGRMFMPLYQGQGEDGFFLSRDLTPARLALAAKLREMGAQQALNYMPGVRLGDREDALLVEPRYARGVTRELLRLLGYRRWRRVGNDVEFSRRRQIV